MPWMSTKSEEEKVDCPADK